MSQREQFEKWEYNESSPGKDDPWDIWQAAQAAAVPEVLRKDQCDSDWQKGYVKGWNSCVASMLAALQAELVKAKDIPMKYKRMEFNAQLQNENTRLQAENAELRKREEWITNLFERKWNGVVGTGNSHSYHLRGDWRHIVGALSGPTLSDAIDSAMKGEK